MSARTGMALLALLVVGALAGGYALGGDARAVERDDLGPGTLLRSAKVYPAQRVALRMDHAHPAHRRLQCVRCHRDVPTSGQSRDLLVPGEESCVGCHARDTRPEIESRTGARGDQAWPLGSTRAQTERDADCALCHLGTPTPRAYSVAASSFPPPNLHFSHAAHAGTRCATCHEGVQDATLATRAHLPSMRQCFDCHGSHGIGRQVEGAHTECEGCHLQRPDGRLRFGPTNTHAQATPPRWLHGMDHDPDFLVRHRWVAADHGELCAQCHEESECVDCHDGRVRPSRVHRGDFLTTHATAAQRNDPECASCHQTQRFCGECHARLGLAQISAPRARTGRFHPPEFSDAHGDEARRAMTQCASCHVEQDCIACHGALGIGAGLSPHPPGFASRCARALDQNPRACVLCHGDATTLRARCGG